MARVIPLPLAVFLAACTYGPGGPPPLPPLAASKAQPVEALAEHVLAAYFGETPRAPAVCLSVAPRALDAAEERALRARFPRLAANCTAEAIEIRDFACETAEACSAWVTAPGHPRTRWQLRWTEGSWHFAEDLRMVERR